MNKRQPRVVRVGDKNLFFNPLRRQFLLDGPEELPDSFPRFGGQQKPFSRLSAGAFATEKGDPFYYMP